MGELEALLQHRLTGTTHESTDNDEDGGLSDIALDLDASTTQGSGHLPDYGEVHRGKALLSTPLGSEKCVFRGTYHAESMLGILAYLSHHTHPHLHTVPGLPLFRHTYNTIGISKHCCPVCTKLLTLLSPHRSQSHSTMQTGFTVLNGHRNIYPVTIPTRLLVITKHRSLSSRGRLNRVGTGSQGLSELHRAGGRTNVGVTSAN